MSELDIQVEQRLNDLRNEFDLKLEQRMNQLQAQLNNLHTFVNLLNSQSNEQKMSNDAQDSEELIQLNLRGIKQGFLLSKSVLTKIDGSSLQAMLKRHKDQQRLIDNSVFVDSDPDTFKAMYNYLSRESKIPQYKDYNMQIKFEDELDYRGIPLSEKRQIEKKLQMMFDEAPDSNTFN